MASYYIGLMSGTSMDAIDAAIVQIGDTIQLIDSYSLAIPQDIQQKTRALNHSAANDLQSSLILDRQWGQLFAQTVINTLQHSGIEAAMVRAIGSHGQTVRHAPNAPYAYTLQIGDPNTIAELCGIDVVADFRRRDIAAGGQGAPLAPAFHQAVFASTEERRCIINIGGMANITQLHGDPIIGFDSGPGNVLLDSWIQLHKGLAFDKNGAWAASGKVLPGMLKAMLSDNYFSLAPPKSTGREQFDQHWLETFLTGSEKPEDVQATLAELTARSICSSLPTDTQALYVCGGGAMNTYLMQRLEAISGKTTLTTEALGVSPQWLEAIAFAWLAKQCIEGRHGNIASVTGAIGERVLGAIYQA